MTNAKSLNGRKRLQVSFEQPSKTEQVYKDECSIDFIISNYVKTGIDPREGRKMSYVDCTKVSDFQTAQQLVADTKTMFYSLPAEVRDEFKTIDNYLGYVSDPANLKDCYERNLIDQSTVDRKDIYPDEWIPPVEDKASEGTVSIPQEATKTAEKPATTDS